MSFFQYSQGLTFSNGQFNSVAGNQTTLNMNSTVNLCTAQTALQALSQAIAGVGAAHNSEARYPPPRCHPETREKVRRLFTDWVRTFKRSWFVYWLYGPVGAGKSAVAQSISEECHASKDLVSSFFFSRTHPVRNTSEYLFLTIAYGLACSVPELQESIGRVIQTNPAILDSSLEEQFVQLVVSPCRWLAQREEWGSRPRLVVIDGLDECEEIQMQTRILDIIAKSVREPEGLPLQFLICSRPEPAIREFFDTKVFEPTIWYYILDNDSSTYRDIYIFLRDGLAKVRHDAKYRSCKFPPVWPDLNDVHTIVRKSDGQFVYAATILRFIGGELFNPCRRLKVVLGLAPNVDGDSPYTDLDVLYHHILSANPKQRRTRMEVLGLVFHTRIIDEGFSLRDIETLIEISEGEATLALRGLHSVLEIKDETRVLIRHTSFTDFLHDESRSGTFFIDSASSRSFSASCFIRYLNHLLDTKKFCNLVFNQPTLDLPSRVWMWWDTVCTNVETPTEELLSTLRNLDLGAIHHIIEKHIQDQGRYRYECNNTWWAWLIRTRIIVQWLEAPPRKHQDIASHFCSAGAGFHISVPDASVLDAVSELLAVELLRSFTSVEPDALAELNQHVLAGLEGQVLKTVRAEGCLKHLAASRTLTPIECSAGVFFVEPQHIAPSLLLIASQLDCASLIARVLLEPRLYPGLGVTISFAQVLGPSPHLLPLFEHALPEILDENSFKAMMELAESVLWLKSFPEEYASSTAPILQLVRDRVSHPWFPGRRDHPDRFEELCEALGLGELR